MVATKSIYEYKIDRIDGGVIDFEEFKGKKILIVNTASDCGLTPQYAQLQELHLNFSEKIALIAVPSNQFGGQEPKTNELIAEFCQNIYDISFPVASKSMVTGENKHPLYSWLTEKEQNGFKDSEVEWNFQKYLINETGELVAVFHPSTEPLDDEVLVALGLK